MKRYTLKAIALFFAAAILFLQQGCVKDVCTKTHTYTYYQPVYKTKAEVRANIKSNTPKPVFNLGKIYIKGNYIFLNELDKGIHIIDNTNPAMPKNIAFIDIPGNIDIAVKGNTMYADFYTDLVAMDISTPLNISVTKFVNNVFPERYYYGYSPDSSKIVCDWVKKTETVDVGCNNDYYYPVALGGVLFNTADAGFRKSSAAASPIGISGSLARFVLINNYMYAVSNNLLRVINIANETSPVFTNELTLGWGYRNGISF